MKFANPARAAILGSVADAAILDAIDNDETLAAIDCIGRLLDEELRIALEVIQAAAFNKDPLDRAPRELGAVLQVGQDVG